MSAPKQHEESSPGATIATTPITPPPPHLTSEGVIDVGIDATTLPPINPQNQVIEAADDMFNNLQQYITSEIERKCRTTQVQVN